MGSQDYTIIYPIEEPSVYPIYSRTSIIRHHLETEIISDYPSVGL